MEPWSFRNPASESDSISFYEGDSTSSSVISSSELRESRHANYSHIWVASRCLLDSKNEKWRKRIFLWLPKINYYVMRQEGGRSWWKGHYSHLFQIKYSWKLTSRSTLAKTVNRVECGKTPHLLSVHFRLIRDYEGSIVSNFNHHWHPRRCIPLSGRLTLGDGSKGQNFIDAIQHCKCFWKCGEGA